MLNTDYTNIKDYKRKLYRKLKEGEYGYGSNQVQYKLKPRIETIVFATMITGVPKITEETYNQFYNRLHMVETMRGCFFWKTVRGKHIEDPIRLEEVKSMIGLTSNASILKRNEFMKRFKKNEL